VSKNVGGERKMTRESLKALGVDESLIDEIMKQHGESINGLKDKINQYADYDTKYADYDSIKTELADLKKANMTNEELLVAKQKELDAQIEKTQKEQAKLLKQQNSLEAKSILISAGINDEEQLNGILDSISTDNKDLTIKNANNIANSIKAIKDTTEKTIKEQLMAGEPNPNGGSGKKADGNETMTKEKFDGLSYAEQKEWKDSNLEEYHKMFNND
jgi:hypothetical protein